MSSSEILKKEFIDKYLSLGEEKFYRFLINYAIVKVVSIQNESYKGIAPDMEFLEYHDKLIILYRREGEEVYLKAARVFRKAGHKIYRIMLKKNMTPKNYKFLNLV